MIVVDVLGTEYTIETSVKMEEDNRLKYCDGFCDRTTKKIKIAEKKKSLQSLDDLASYVRKVLRHELVHAFFNESGLGQSEYYGSNEALVDWIAEQYPKIQKVFKELNIEN